MNKNRLFEPISTYLQISKNFAHLLLFINIFAIALLIALILGMKKSKTPNISRVLLLTLVVPSK